MMKPNCLILSYPVITSGEFAHRSSFDHLVGADAEPACLERVSLEKQVTADVPPTFIWHTFHDQMVPMENSLLFATALRQHNIPFELHIYTNGEHGLALSNAVTENSGIKNTGEKSALGDCLEPHCEGWLDMACSWLQQMM